MSKCSSLLKYHVGDYQLRRSLWRISRSSGAPGVAPRWKYSSSGGAASVARVRSPDNIGDWQPCISMLAKVSWHE